MSQDSNNISGCRIIVGFKAEAGVGRSVDAGTLLAETIKADLVGLFVQDEALMNVAGMPFARVLNQQNPTPREFTPDQMQEALTRHAAICKRTLSRRAVDARVRWSFRNERGNMVAVMMAQADAGDIMVMPVETHGLGLRGVMRQVRDSSIRVRGVVVPAISRFAAGAGPVVAMDDGDDAGEGTIRLAARIAIQSGKPLHVFAIASSEKDVSRITERAAQLSGLGLSVTMHRFIPGSPQTIASSLGHIAPSFVVGDMEGEPFRDDQAALSLLRAARAPVLLLRYDSDGG
jgi:hypothetical protein